MPGPGRKPRPAPLDMERVVSCTSVESSVPELALPEPVSKYETDPPDCEPLSARLAAFQQRGQPGTATPSEPCQGPGLMLLCESMARSSACFSFPHTVHKARVPAVQIGGRPSWWVGEPGIHRFETWVQVRRSVPCAGGWPVVRCRAAGVSSWESRPCTAARQSMQSRQMVPR